MKRRIDHYASFKDPAAKVFSYENEEEYIYRELHPAYLEHYRHLQSSGLATELVKKNLLIPFEETADKGTTILRAARIPFVSYPFEWTFNQWKDAALVTLKIQFQALKFGMTLKDASPFNIVFDGPTPLFIDISSFEILKEGTPWLAYKQFSENFYMPLLLHKYFGKAGNDIYLSNSNGIPLHKGLPILPLSARVNFNTLFYLTLPNTLRERVKNSEKKYSLKKTFSQKRSMQFAEQLFLNISKIKKKKNISKWNRYYDEGRIDSTYLEEKEKVVKEWLSKDYENKTLVDFGCNTGNFSTLVSPYVKTILAFDEDIHTVDELYIQCREQKIHNIFSFCADISQPTPSTGFNNAERASLKERLNADVGLALALVHHLVFTHNINFEMIACMFADSCNELIIEFIPKEDEKVQLLLSGREDIFEWYSLENFKNTFEKKFSPGRSHRFKNNRLLVHFTSKKNEQ